MKLVIGYFYPKLLNLYGDDGNVQILSSRAKARGIDVEVVNITLETKVTKKLMSSFDIVFMGGGPDSGQKEMYGDLLKNKKSFIKDYVESGKVGLFICGSYQLLGNYYKAADGAILKGLGVFDLYTHHFGIKFPRCIGNVVAKTSFLKEHFFLVGFENHGGRTFLGKGVKSLAKVIKGHGNNSTDKTEGVIYKNSIGTYLHGPVLSKNPHLADYLLAKSIGCKKLHPLEDSIIWRAHDYAKKIS